MQEMKDFHQEGKTLLYPRLLINSCCDTDELAELVADETTFSAGEIRGMLLRLQQVMAREMGRGRSIKIDRIGIFTPRLVLKKGAEREAPDGSGTKRNADSVQVGKVAFRADKELLDNTDRRCNLSRAPKDIKHRISQYTPEERLARAVQYLETHPILTVLGYANLNGLSRTSAWRELRKWSQTAGSGIGCTGSGTHLVYIRKPTE